mgnify:CR=1 FL=1
MLSRMIIPATQASEQHWNDRARALLTLFMGYMISQGKGKTLEDLSRLVSPSDGSIDTVLAEIHTCGDEDCENRAARFLASKGGVGETSKEFSSVLSTLYNNLDQLCIKRVNQSTRKSSFSLENIADGEYAIYLIPPSKSIEEGAKWLRLMIMVIMRSIVRKHGAKHHFTFLLDEFASLGYIKEIEIAVQQYRGYNIFSWIVLQELSQLQKLYRDTWRVFVGSANVQLFWGIKEAITAEYISKLSGVTTVSAGNNSEKSRPLLTPDEVTTYSQKMILAKFDGLPMANLAKLPYHLKAEPGKPDTWTEFYPDWHSRYPENIPQELK